MSFCVLLSDPRAQAPVELGLWLKLKVTLNCGGFKTSVVNVVLSALAVGTCHSNAGTSSCGSF